MISGGVGKEQGKWGREEGKPMVGGYVHVHYLGNAVSIPSGLEVSKRREAAPVPCWPRGALEAVARKLLG